MIEQVRYQRRLGASRVVAVGFLGKAEALQIHGDYVKAFRERLEDVLP
jgi:hypothetical protein